MSYTPPGEKPIFPNEVEPMPMDSKIDTGLSGTLRVLMLTILFVRGGAERRMAATAQGLRRHGCEVRLVAGRRPPPGDICDMEDLFRGLDIREAPSSTMEEVPPSVASAIAAVYAHLDPVPDALHGLIRVFAEAIVDYRPTVVHGWIHRYAIIAGILACHLGVPRVVIGITSMTPAQRGFADAETLRRAARALAMDSRVRFVSVSRVCAEEHERWLGLAPGTIGTIYPGLAPEAIRRPSARAISDLRASLGLEPETPVVGTVTRFVAEKDLDLWLDVASKVVLKRPDVRFVMAGYGWKQRQIVERLAELGLQDKVLLPGLVINAGLYCAAFDVFLLTSQVEGLSLALVEAQAAGCAVVAVPVGGIPEAMQPSVTGRLCSGRSPGELAGAVLDVLADHGCRDRARVAGPSFVAARFGYRRMISETLALYTDGRKLV